MVTDQIRQRIQRIMEARQKKQEFEQRKRELLARMKLYHFTDERNVPSIREWGGIFSLEQSEALAVEITAPGGDENSQQSDRSNGMDKYVHLCLRDEHPMEYRARTGGRIEKSIFIRINRKVLELDGVRFVPGMSNKTGIPTYTLEEAVRDNRLEEADLIAMYERTDWNVGDNYERRVRAEKFEILVPDFIPIDMLEIPNG